MTPLLSVRDLSFSYGEREIFHDVNFSSIPGGVICVMGPNGCGKTTLLDCIMALHRPSAGEVLLRGRSVGNYKRHELARSIAFVPQLHEITFPYTVKEVVLMGRTAYAASIGRPTPEDEKLSLEAIGRMGLSRYADTPYNQLSGGEVKLVLLARALVQGAPLILMDEPTAHLDFRNEMLFLESVVRLCREGISVIIATHSPNQALYFSTMGVPVAAALFGGDTIRYMGAAEDVIDSRTIGEVFGVEAKLLTDTAADGTPIRTMYLIRSNPEEK